MDKYMFWALPEDKANHASQALRTSAIILFSYITKDCNRLPFKGWGCHFAVRTYLWNFNWHPMTFSKRFSLNEVLKRSKLAYIPD